MLCAERTGGGGSHNPPPLFLRKLVQRIREEFEYFPGLRLTASQAARFWGLDSSTCQQVLTELLGAGFLAREADRYLKRSA
jgi:Fic family protein